MWLRPGRHRTSDWPALPVATADFVRKVLTMTGGIVHVEGPTWMPSVGHFMTPSSCL